MNLAHDLERRAAEDADRTALIFEAQPGLSFAALDARASRLGGALARLGVTDGAQLALFLQNGPDLVCCLYGLWKTGGVPITLSPLYGAAELSRSLAKTRPFAIVTDAEGLATVRAADVEITVAVVGTSNVPDGVVDLETMAAACAPELPAPALANSRDAVVLFTGGTSGAPKAVAMTHGGTYDTMARLARAAKGGKPGPYPIAPETTPPNLVPLPLFHSGGQQALLFAFHVGRSVVLMKKFSAERAAALVTRHRIDNLFLLPTMLYDLAELPGEPDLDSVRSVLVAGGEVSAALRARFEQRFGIPLLSNYGSTEMGHVAGWTAGDVKSGAWVPGSAGRVYDGVEVSIRDDAGKALPAGEAGEICVRSSVSSGYVDGGSENLIDADGCMHSGDIGYLDEDGVLFLIGRKREMIKCGGFQVWPMELEEELRRHPAVADLAVVGAPDDRLGEIPKAFVVLCREAGKPAELEQDLLEFSRQKLAKYKAVRALAFVAELPRTAAGKVDRHALRSMAVSG